MTRYVLAHSICCLTATRMKTNKGMIIMKSTGIVREIDKLGRIVLPVELRRTLEINTGDLIEFFTEGNAVILKKHSKLCHFCGNDTSVTQFKGRNICNECIDELKKQSEPKQFQENFSL